MTLVDLKQKPAQSILGLDLNSSKMAFALFDQKHLTKYGEITFPGATLFQRMNAADKILRSLKSEFVVDKIIFESAVYVNNRRTVVDLAYIYGAIVSTLADFDIQIEAVSPLEWGRAIGNKGLSKAEKADIQKSNPGKTKTWYANQYRAGRKQITKDWVAKTFQIDTTKMSDDVTDAIAVVGAFI